MIFPEDDEPDEDELEEEAPQRIKVTKLTSSEGCSDPLLLEDCFLGNSGESWRNGSACLRLAHASEAVA